MNCPSCQHENRAGARFCEACGVKIDKACASCGEILTEKARFCPGCGTAVEAPKTVEEPAPRTVAEYTPKHLAEKILHSRSALEGERKQVTVMFADVKGSMDLARQLDPEEWHHLLDGFFHILTTAVHRYEGTVNQYTGDGIMALFGAPVAHEDHAIRACYAADQIVNELNNFRNIVRSQHGLAFDARIGINSGDVVVGKIGDDFRMDYTAQGMSVGTAQRIEQLAEPGTAYLSGTTEQMARGYVNLRHVGASQLKGVEDPVEIYVIEGSDAAHTRIEAAQTRGLSRLVGRERELQTLETAFAHAAEGFGQIVGVTGEPGLGKSRLCYEFSQKCKARGVAVYETHCFAHDQNLPLIPIQNLLRSLFHLEPGETTKSARAKIDHVLRLVKNTQHIVQSALFDFLDLAESDAAPPPLDPELRERLLYSIVRKLVERLDHTATAKVLLIDDLHWIDAGSDAFVNQIADSVENTRTLLLVNFRPEYTAPWTHKSYYQQVALTPLGERSVRAILAEQVGSGPGIDELSTQIIADTGGNPFFAEEVARFAIESGVVVKDGEHYSLVDEGARLDTPPTVQSLVAARIDRLDPLPKRIIQYAAVIGRTFDRELLEQLIAAQQADFQHALSVLKEREFIRDHALFPRVELRFRHPLSHEVAYNAQLTSHRRATHAEIAGLMQKSTDSGDENKASVIAYHYDHADMPDEAMIWHETAARLTVTKDTSSSIRHWRRLRELVNDVPSTNQTLSAGALACTRMLGLCWQLGSSEDEAERIFRDGIHLATRANDTELLARINNSYAVMRGINLGYAEDNIRYANEAVAFADKLNDPLVRASSSLSLANGYLLNGKFNDVLQISNAALSDMPEDNEFARWGVSPRPVFLTFRAIVTFITNGDNEKTWADLRMAEDLAKKNEALEIEVYIHSVNVWLASIAGDTDKVQHHADATHQCAAQTGTALSQCHNFLALGRAAIATERFEDSKYYFESLMDVSQSHRAGGSLLGSGRAGLARVHNRLGEIELAISMAREAVDYVESRALFWDLSPWMCLTEIEIGTGDQQRAEKTLKTIEALILRSSAKVYRGIFNDLAAK